MNNTFETFGLSAEIIKAISELGFENPTPIQEKAIPQLLTEKNDFVGLAQTGTGKTAGFGLPIIQMTDVLSDNVQSLILSPTRELCIQIAKDFESYAKYLPDLRIQAVYGGTEISKQIRELKQKPHIVVGTPGRVLDMINRKVLKVSKIKWCVLDEADEMLNMGFREDLNRILEATTPKRQTLLFSATMPKEVRAIAENYMYEPVEVTIGKKNSGAENVKHEYYVVHAKDRYEALKRISDINPNIYGIVFCRTRKETKEIADKYMNDGYNADALHGDLSQAQRDHVMQRFRTKNIQMLVATDVAARGLDVNDLTHVINFNLPDDLESYIHRSGRTGRAGKDGTSISIIHTRDVKKISEIERMIKKKFEKKKIPTGNEICEKQLFKLIDRVQTIEVDESQIDGYLEDINTKLEDLSREDLIKRFVSIEFNRFIEYYRDSADINVTKKSKADREERKERRRRDDVNMTRFFINVGDRDRLSAARLMGLLNEQTRNRSLIIGKIDIMKSFSFFEVDSSFADDVLGAFKRPVEFEGVKVSVEISKPAPRRNKEGGGDRNKKGDSSRGGDRRGGRDRGGNRDNRSAYKGRRRG